MRNKKRSLKQFQAQRVSVMVVGFEEYFDFKTRIWISENFMEKVNCEWSVRLENVLKVSEWTSELVSMNNCIQKAFKCTPPPLLILYFDPPIWLYMQSWTSPPPRFLLQRWPQWKILVSYWFTIMFSSFPESCNIFRNYF